MKKLLFTSISLVLLVSCGGTRIAAADVPSAVMTAFNTKYPNAANVEWEKEKEKGKIMYEAEFQFNGKKTEAEFSEDGKFVEED
jgi:hypothetical protein